MSGWRDLFALVLGWKSSGAATLADEQKTTGGEPVVTLTIGVHSLDAFVWGYRYEEHAENIGRLTIWLVNVNDEFDDLGSDYPDLKRGASIDLRRGLPVDGVDTTEKLPRTWIEGLRYTYLEGTPLLEISCIDWRKRLQVFRYSTEQNWAATEIATIAGSILSEVSLTLASGSFGFSIDFDASPRRAGDQILMDLMRRVDEYLYSGLDGEVKHKELDPNEGSSYPYDWGQGPASGSGYGSGNHPMLSGSEVAETSGRYNHVVVNGSESYTGSATDATEIALVGTRLRTITDRKLTSDAQCAERARAELRFWLAQTIVGTIVARPHFTLRMYDVLSLAAPPWGGGTVVGRVRRIVEEYGRGRSIWQQEIEIGGLAGKATEASDLADGSVDASKVLEGTITVDEIAAGAVEAGTIAAGAVDTQHLATDAVEADKINVSTLSAITADMGTLTAGVIKMGTGTKDDDLDGFQIDADELVGQNSGVDQVILSSSDGKITAGAGALVLDEDGIQANSGNADVNKLKIRDGANTVLGLYGEVNDGTGTSGTLECAGKQAADPEGQLELVAITYNGSPASGVASVSVSLDTETSRIDVGGATRMVMGTTYLEMTEQAAGPDAPGADRGRLYLIDNGSGKT